VQAAPLGLAQAISVVAMTKGAVAGGSTLGLVKGALKIITWTKTKTVVAACAFALLAGGTATNLIKRFSSPDFSLKTWNAAQKYLEEERQRGKEHNGVVLVEELRRTGYLDERTYRWAKQQGGFYPSNAIGLPQFKVPDDLGTNKIAWITMKQHSIVLVIDGASD
jgi:hypothetical protein